MPNYQECQKESHLTLWAHFWLSSHNSNYGLCLLYNSFVTKSEKISKIIIGKNAPEDKKEELKELCKEMNIPIEEQQSVMLLYYPLYFAK